MKIRRQRTESSSQQPLISSATLHYVTRIESAISKPGGEKPDYVVDDGIVYATIKNKMKLQNKNDDETIINDDDIVVWKNVEHEQEN